MYLEALGNQLQAMIKPAARPEQDKAKSPNKSKDGVEAGKNIVSETLSEQLSLDMKIDKVDKTDKIDQIHQKEEKQSEENENPFAQMQELNQEKMKKVIELLSEQLPNSEAKFGIHEKTNRVMIKLVDKDTHELIKEFPPEKTLDIIAKCQEVAGIMLDTKL